MRKVQGGRRCPPSKSLTWSTRSGSASSTPRDTKSRSASDMSGRVLGGYGSLRLRSRKASLTCSSFSCCGGGSEARSLCPSAPRAPPSAVVLWALALAALALAARQVRGGHWLTFPGPELALTKFARRMRVATGCVRAVVLRCMRGLRSKRHASLRLKTLAGGLDVSRVRNKMAPAEGVETFNSFRSCATKLSCGVGDGTVPTASRWGIVRVERPIVPGGVDSGPYVKTYGPLRGGASVREGSLLAGLGGVWYEVRRRFYGRHGCVLHGPCRRCCV